jgi:S1-C subfamily serine protease
VNGVVVVDVMNGSPAARGGMRPCDLIEQVGGKTMKSPADVQLAVDQARVGQSLEVVVRRGDQRRTVNVQPGELPRQGQG